VYESESADLREGDTILLYSDGILEAGGLTGREEFGLEKIRAYFGKGGRPRDIVDRLDAGLAEHLAGEERDDDVTLVCLQRTRAGS
jgi:serine phosphatase RsbU (regulator of sigma subunit)